MQNVFFECVVAFKDALVEGVVNIFIEDKEGWKCTIIVCSVYIYIYIYMIHWKWYRTEYAHYIGNDLE